MGEGCFYLLATKIEGVIKRPVLPEIRKIVREELGDLRVIVDERFKAVNMHLNAIDERITGLRDVVETLKLMPRLVELERKIATLEAKTAASSK
jgi:hypothetical protein